MERGVKKRSGRFIKNKGVLMDTVQMEEFSFSEICSAPIAQADNARRNVIRAKLHESSELERVILKHPGMGEELLPFAQRPPMIRPVDFTIEWEKNRRRASHRGAGGDDDDFDYLEDQGSPRPAATVARVDASRGATASDDGLAATPAPDSKGMLNIVSEAFKEEQARVAAEKIFRGFEGEPIAVPAPAAGPVMDHAQPAQQAQVRETVQDFIPMASGHPVDVERDAMGQYRHRLESRMSEEGVIKEIEEESRSRGYSEGFRLGEEKGEIQMRQATQNMFSKLGEVLGELETLKGTVLDNVQDNFHDLTQAIAESLLRREFDIHPEALGEVISRAIKESVDSDQFRVLVHPATRDRLETMNIKQMDGRLVSDDAIPEGDFRIESKLKVVNGRVGVMVTELLRQADMGLFEKEKAV